MTPFERGATYRRISKDDADTRDGVIRQTEDTEALAVKREIPVADRHRFEDNDISATHGKHRPGYEALMVAVKRDEIDVIVVTYLNRLWRNRRERAEGIEILRKHNVSVLCVKGPELDLTTATGRLLGGLLGEVDTFEVEQMMEKEQRKMQQSVQRGAIPTGPRCFGYTKMGNEVIAHEAKEVVQSFNDLLAGATLSGIATALNERKVLNRNGKPFTHNTVRWMLLNERYAGLRQYQGALYPADQPVIVPEEIWRKAVSILTDKARATSPGPARKWLLSGLALCGVCGAKVTSAQRGTKGESSERTYKCSGPVKHLNRKAEPIDDLIANTDAEKGPLGLAIQILSRDDAADLLLNKDQPDVEELRNKVIALRAKLDGYTEDYDADLIDRKQFLDGTARTRVKLAEAETAMTNPDKSAILGELIEADDPCKAWDSLPLDRKRAVVDTLMTITIDRCGPGRRAFDPESIIITPKES